MRPFGDGYIGLPLLPLVGAGAERGMKRLQAEKDAVYSQRRGVEVTAAGGQKLLDRRRARSVHELAVESKDLMFRLAHAKKSPPRDANSRAERLVEMSVLSC